MRELTDSERDYLIAYWFSEPLFNIIALPERFKEGFIAALDYNAERIAALTAERDALRALLGRVVEGLPHTSYYQYYGDTELRQLIKDCQEALR